MGGKNTPHKFLSIKDKLKILQELEIGVSATTLAVKYGIAKSTVTGIRKNSTKILTFAKDVESNLRKRKTLKTGELPRMEQELYKWFLTQRSRNLPISSSLLAGKALHFNKIHKECPNFIASRGWVQKFRARHGIRILKVTGEKLSNHLDSVDPFISEFRSKINELSLTPDQIYNADESGLFWKLLPDKTLVCANEKSAPGRKIGKERLTFLACCNASGEHKLKPLVIGKSRNPRAFKNFHLPVHYKSSANSWMTSNIFRQWFEECFSAEVTKFLDQKGLPRKALLLIDNAPCHPPNLQSLNGCIVTMNLPPNCTALLQPMDQNVINLTKLCYKKKLLAKIVSEDNENVARVIKSLTLKDAVSLLASSWSELTHVSIKSCWKKLMPYHNNDSDWDDEDLIPLAVLKQSEANNDLTRVQNLMAQIGGDVPEQEIREWINESTIQGPIISEEDSNEDIEDVQSNKVSATEVLKAANLLLTWAMQKENLSPNIVSSLRNIREMATNQALACTKQSSIKSFLKL